jgi:hypothetical protein
MNRHCAHQRWHSHPSQCCHCRVNVSGSTSPILHNSKIFHLRLIVDNERSYHNWHPTNQFLPFAIEVFGCLHKHANVFLHDCVNAIWSLKWPKGPLLSTLITFLCQKVSITLQKIQMSSILSRTVAIGLATSWLPPLQNTPPITMVDLLQAIDFWHKNMVNLPQALHSEHEIFLTSTLSQLDIL